MSLKQIAKGIGASLAPELTTELLSWRSQRLIMKNERTSGRLAASQHYCAQRGSVVAKGPFKGMRYPRFTVECRNLIPKLIGSYEDELSPWMEEIVARHYPTIVNVGSADGYYTVGLALRCAAARVIAFDTDPWARTATRALASENSAGNVEVHKMCTPRWMREQLLTGSIALVDCEGFEAQLLDLQAAPNLVESDFLVELHEHVDPGIGERISGMFEATHDIRSMPSRAKPPADYPELEDIEPSMRARVIYERAPDQNWLYLTRKA